MLSWDAEKTLQLLFHANRLKAIPRVGWQMRERDFSERAGTT